MYIDRACRLFIQSLEVTVGIVLVLLGTSLVYDIAVGELSQQGATITVAQKVLGL